MANDRRWDPCIAHRDTEVGAFVRNFFSSAGRSVLFIGGAGFDPRSTAVATQLAATGVSMRALFLQENRPNPVQELVDRATANTSALLRVVNQSHVVAIEIFGPDGAVVGGRNVVNLLSRQPLDGITDVVMDISALSVGTSFPMIRFFVERIEQGSPPINLHAFVAHDPKLDTDIRSVPSDVPGYVHGYKGGSTLYSSGAAAKLWLPQLATGRQQALNRLHEFVSPHDTCPILPFPASDPRLGDVLAEEYLTELESGWSVDTRNLVYADESDPLDLYRTILRLDDLRKPVFKEAGGSLLVLSPLGSKVMALGALMAALERDLPVAHLEPIGYYFESPVPREIAAPNLVHIWLEGDVYPRPRPALQIEGTPA